MCKLFDFVLDAETNSIVNQQIVNGGLEACHLQQGLQPKKGKWNSTSNIVAV